MRVVGRVAYEVREDGRLVAAVAGANRVVAGGPRAIAAVLAGVNSARIAQLGVGVGAAPPALADAALTDDVRVPLMGAEADGAEVRFRWEVGRAIAVGRRLTELGLYTAAGDLVARKRCEAPIDKTARLSLHGVWTLVLSA